jgi:hypothetical protein
MNYNLKLSMEVRFQVLTAGSIKVTVSWVVALCRLVEVYRRFRDTSCLHIALTMETPNAEDSHLLSLEVLLIY